MILNWHCKESIGLTECEERLLSSFLRANKTRDVQIRNLLAKNNVTLARNLFVFRLISRR